MIFQVFKVNQVTPGFGKPGVLFKNLAAMFYKKNCPFGFLFEGLLRNTEKSPCNSVFG
jgi:hypothetical protein